MMRRATGAVAMALLLAGCSGSGANESSPTPTPTGPTRYDSVTALRDVAVDAGYSCPSWRQTDQVLKAAQSGTCSDQDVFSIYLSNESVETAVLALKQGAPAKMYLLTGANWIINAPGDDVYSLKDALGGTVVEVGH